MRLKEGLIGKSARGSDQQTCRKGLIDFPWALVAVADSTPLSSSTSPHGWRLGVRAAHDAPQKWVVLGHSPSKRGRARPGLGMAAPVLAEGQSRVLLAKSLRNAGTSLGTSPGPEVCMSRENEEHPLERTPEGALSCEERLRVGQNSNSCTGGKALGRSHKTGLQPAFPLWASGLVSWFKILFVIKYT